MLRSRLRSLFHYFENLVAPYPEASPGTPPRGLFAFIKLRERPQPSGMGRDSASSARTALVSLPPA
ncbi:hypothetical protein [uncultured Halomonas sp.]|uniref:hypothetical protein n=1 Tax=uncultured Halomonas sp. TaxID=173971 RepID=UPI0026280E5F|nr:hypothetical protein [uncultured Halomonas sp.]